MRERSQMRVSGDTSNDGRPSPTVRQAAESAPATVHSAVGAPATKEEVARIDKVKVLPDSFPPSPTVSNSASNSSSAQSSCAQTVHPPRQRLDGICEGIAAMQAMMAAQAGVGARPV